MSHIIAIGDIHGCRLSLEALARAADFSSADRLVFLGDYVDRGPDSKGVIDWLIQNTDGKRAAFLRGNHEVMMLEARQNSLKAHTWSSFGGFETLISYGSEYEPDWIPTVPESHWRFLAGTQVQVETDDFIFVHGFLDAQRPAAEQDRYKMIWGRCDEMRPHCSGKKVICGHTPQQNGVPGEYDWGVCIDTGAYKGGWLTSIDPVTGEYCQANEAGESRKGNLHRPG